MPYDPTNPMNQFQSKPRKFGSIITALPKRNHEESDLHLAFCKWVKANYPKLDFIRHERERKRTPFMQNLFMVFNSNNDKMPDFELLHPSGQYHRLYIEFKKPGEKWMLKDGITIKSEYADQYKRHIAFWKENSPAYFCNSLEDAQRLLQAYLSGVPLPRQIHVIVDPVYLPF